MPLDFASQLWSHALGGLDLAAGILIMRASYWKSQKFYALLRENSVRNTINGRFIKTVTLAFSSPSFFFLLETMIIHLQFFTVFKPLDSSSSCRLISRHTA